MKGDRVKTNQIICDDCREVMQGFPEDSIDLAVTSPPYWGLRDYGDEVTGIWGGDKNCEHEWGNTLPSRREKSGEHGPNSNIGAKQAQHKVTDSDSGCYCVKCGAWRGQLGLEPHPNMFIDHLVEISRGVKRVLKPEGSFWLNLGDTYYSNPSNQQSDAVGARGSKREPRRRNRNLRSNWLQPKQLLGIPWRVATALQEDGWILRNCVIWYKPNHMPESVRDRLTKSYEFFFFFVKQQKYYFNLDEIRQPYADSTFERINYPRYGEGSKGRQGNYATQTYDYNPLNKNGKNPGDMWRIPTQSFSGSHFAVFPEKLIKPIIKSSSPKDGVVLDPFAGSGTTCYVARKIGRQFIGIELNPEYAEMARERVRGRTFKRDLDGVQKLTDILLEEEQ